MSNRSGSYRTPLGRVRGLGSAKEGTHHWWAQRLTALALIPLLLWLVISILANVGAGYASMREWLSTPGAVTLLILTFGVTFYHGKLGIQVVIEDYVHHHAAKHALLILNSLVSFLLAAFGIVSVLMIAIGD